MSVTLDEWTVVARSTRPGLWIYAEWLEQSAPKPAIAIRRFTLDAQNEAVVVMHRKIAGGWELVARLPPQSWRHVKRWRDRNPLSLPHMMAPS